jgi:membrane associated rhomboid family serine protease
VFPLRDDVPTRRAPVLTVGLIAANVLAFLWQVLVAGLPLSVQVGGLVPAELLTLRDLGPPDLVPPPLTLLTSMFLHGGFGHIAGNMLFLWIFGNNVEDVLGRPRFLAFYGASGRAAALAQVAASWAADDLLTPMVGASGAIAGVLAAYLSLFPGARVLTLVPPFWLVELPAFLVIGLWVLFQVLGVLFDAGGGGGVAFAAHVGGFAAGWILIHWWWRGRR